ncbi:MAG TPA: hypothetical protein ENH15_00480, partial [Actinobacteria bacterium]|nr:hypothetical protein [Actinomycetota bacterium]
MTNAEQPPIGQPPGAAVDAFSRRRRILGIFVVSLLLPLAVGAGWWASRQALISPQDPLAAVAERVIFEVAEGRLGRSLTFNAVAEWEQAPLAPTAAAGTVTSVGVADGDLVDIGDVVFSVDLRPVVVASGLTPMFRDLALRAEGPDVAQLQAFLAFEGLYEGELDGKFGSGTRAAVREWQDTMGVDDDGKVRRGDIVFFAELPARVALGDDVAIGVALTGGEQTLWSISDEPSFWIPLSLDQRTLVPLSSAVNVTYPDGVWAAHTVKALESPEEGQLHLTLEGVDGEPVCGA